MVLFNLYSRINVFIREKDIGNPCFCIHTFVADTKTRIDLNLVFIHGTTLLNLYVRPYCVSVSQIPEIFKINMLLLIEG